MISDDLDDDLPATASLPPVQQGRFQYTYSGIIGCGAGFFAITDGAIEGGDMYGLLYSGTVSGRDDGIHVSIRLDVLRGRELVMGVSPQEIGYQRDVTFRLRYDFANGEPMKIEVPPGHIWLTILPVPEGYGIPINRRTLQKLAQGIEWLAGLIDEQERQEGQPK